MFPFTPSKDTMERRVVFIWSKEKDAIYKITIVGSSAEVHKTSFEQNRNFLPQSIASGKSNKWGGPRERQIGDEMEFYKQVDWEETEIIKVTKLNRSNELDEIEVSLGEKNTANKAN